MKLDYNKNFSRYRERYISVEEMNEHLKYVEKTFEIVYRAKEPGETFKRKAFIEDKQVYFKLSYKKGSFACTYICRKDGQNDDQKVNGGEAFRILSRYYKVPKMPEEICGRAEEGGLSASPILYCNPKFEGTRQKAWGYDLNSAYSAAMLEDMPDTSKPWKAKKIVEGKEIGFEEILNPKNPNKTMLVPKYKGFSLYVFPLMESPFKRFVEVWYNKKASSIPGSSERAKAKGVLNFSVGQLQNINPFLRAAIIGKCNNLISKLIDEDTLFCNTDSIVSRKPLDLKIGSAIGEWKLEHDGEEVAYIGNNYQWSDGTISYRSIPKAWFPKNWDILTDKLPNNGNVYKFEQMRLRYVK